MEGEVARDCANVVGGMLLFVEVMIVDEALVTFDLLDDGGSRRVVKQRDGRFTFIGTDAHCKSFWLTSCCHLPLAYVWNCSRSKKGTKEWLVRVFDNHSNSGQHD